MNKWTKAIVLTIFYLGIARAMSIFWVTHLAAQTGITVGTLLTGSGTFPFQYRVLGPWIIGFISQIFNLPLLSAQLIFYWLAFFAAFVALRYWLHPFVPPVISDLAPFWLVPLIIGNVATRYPWDALTFVFMPLLLGLLYRKKWAWLVITFAIATLSRETTLLIIFAVAILAIYSKEERKQLLLIGLLCALVWGVEKFLLAQLYEGAQESAMNWWTLQQNIQFFTGKLTPTDEAANLGVFHFAAKDLTDFVINTKIFYSYPLSLITFFSWANFAWVLIFPKWRKKDFFLRQMAWLIPIYFTIMMCVGIIFEKRIYFELYPIVIALALQTFFEGQKS